MEEESAAKKLWEKQKLVALYVANETVGDQLLKYIIPGISRVVDTVTGRTAVVYKIIPKHGVQVWVKERGQERENWPWHMITVRQPRFLKRYPRPFRWPREEPTKQCHCKIGRMEVENVEERAVRCTRCKQLVGSESYPRRIERAEEFLRKADNAKSRPQVHKRVLGRAKRKTNRKDSISVKARKRKARKSSGGVVVRPKRRANAKRSNRKTRKRAVVPKNHKKVSKSHALPKVQRKVAQKARTQRKVK